MPGLGPDGAMAYYIVANARHLDSIGDPVTRCRGALADAGVTPMHAIDDLEANQVRGRAILVP